MILTADESGGRLDKFIADHTDLTRSAVQKLIDEGRVTAGGVIRKSNYTLKAGETPLRFDTRTPPNKASSG